MAWSALFIAWAAVSLQARTGTADLAQDTTYILAMLDRADQASALWQLDSVTYYASLAHARILPLTKDRTLMKDPAMRRRLLSFKARSLDLIGHVERRINDLSALDEAFAIYTELGDLHGQAMVHIHYSVRYNTLGDPIKEIEHKRIAIDLFERNGDKQDAAHWLNSLGESYRILGHPSTALEYHLQVLPILQAMKDSAEIAFTYILIGAVHRSTQQWSGALSHFHIARHKYEELHDTLGTAMSYNDLGTAWFGSGDLDSALYWHRRAADLRAQVKNFHGLAHSLRYTAEIYARQQRHDEAITAYKLAAQNYQRVPSYSQVAQAWGSIARIQMDRNEPDSALASITHALDLLQRFNEAKFAFLLYRQLGEIHLFRGELDAARRSYERALAIARESSSVEMEVSVTRELSELHESQGDFRNAYLYHRTYLAARDSLRSRSSKSEVLRLMLEHNAEQAKAEKERDHEERRLEQQAELGSAERQRQLYMAGGGILVLLAIGLVGRLRFSARSRRALQRKQQDLERAKQRAEQSEKFKERFLANMSHEIRTPMNAIMGMTTIMRRNTHLPHQEVYLNAIGQSSENLLHIINDILDLSKLDADRLELEMTPMDPVNVVRTIIEELAPRAAAKGLGLRSEIEDDLPRSVLGDTTRLRQLLMNLAENAVKYTREGHVDITVTAGPITTDGMSMVFAISDTGPGIPPERMDSIFEEFNKAYAYSDGHGRYGGTGLGLAISKRLTELHGGKLTVDSKLGSGTTFTTIIPYTVVAPEDVGPTTESNVELHDLRLLVADDNEFNLMVATDELTDAIPGVRIDVARNGKEAVEQALLHGYDAILMDVQMPEMNGYDATRAIREAELIHGTRRIPILAMTANALDTEIARCHEAGMDGFVPKPFRREELLSELRTLLSDRT